MAEFKLQPNRDAWATIRGYCYQVDLCINAWLDIGTNQILLLEHGEDIDVITRSLSTDLVDSIALEQVKHRQKSLTLRSPEIIEFLVNAVIHLNNNPNQNLSIRYLTNTNYGSEQGVKRAPFLREWQQVRQHQYDEPEQTEVANEIHEFLKGTKRPIKIGKDQWKTYTSFIEALSPEKLLDFVGKIHWQFGLPDHEQISESIKLRIITLKYTENSKVAENIYQRLFWFIYSKLSVAGRKELKSEELTKQIEYAISGADAEEIQSLYKRLSSLDVRVSENTKKIADLNERLHKHLSSEEVKDVAIINASEILIDVPPMPHILIDRPQIDQSIEKLLKSSVCVNIHSSIGTGKSLVALQLVRKRNSIIWVRLRDQDTSAALQLLILALKAFLKSKGVVLSNANDLKALLENLPDEISIVIDDCPRMTRSDPLYEVLLIIAERMRKINGILLITGTTPLPGKSSLGKDLIDYPLPPLLDAEAGNLFKVFNAPERFRSAAGAKGFNAIASRNITILLGIIEYLAQNDWKLTAAVISDVLSKKPMEQISDEVVEELIRRVVDTDARELLYRLKLVIHDFTDDTVVKIASIAPAIQDPLTKIHSLKGRWIETVSTGRYNLAPLFKQLPKTMLRSDITKRVYHTLGMMLLEIGTLGPNEVNQSIMYFIGAEEYLIVSDILMKAYMSLSFQEETTDQLLFIKLWKHTSLPKQIPLPRRVIIRTYQLVHTRKDDADFDTILKSIMEMRESLGNDFHSTLAFIMSASIQSLFLGIENIDYAFKLIRQWSIRWDNLSPSEKQLLGSIDQLGPAIIPWSSLFHIKNLDDVSRWLIQVEQLPTVIQQEIISHNMSFVGTKYIIDKCWPHPDDGELDSQQWKSLAISLEDLANRASEIGFNLFWAWAIRSVIIIECEQLGKFDEGIQRGLKLIELEHDSSVIKFIILDIVGKEYYHEQKYDQAIPRLLQCLEEDGSNYPDVQILTYINLSIAYSTSDDIERLTAVDNSIEFKSLVDEIDYLSIVKAYGTKAIAQWQIYGVAHALEPLSQLSEILWVHANRSSPLWKDLFILTGHVAGFFLALARTGKGPDTTKNGDPYLTPSAGHFTTYHTERHTLFKPEEEIMLYLQLFGLAREFCNTIEMSKWYGVAKKFIEQNPLNFCAKSSYMISCGYLELSDDRYDYFIKYGLDAGIHTTVQRYCINKELPTPYYESDLTAILDSENEWAAADEYSFHLIIAPIVFALAIESIQQNDKFDLHMTQVIMEISRHMEKGYAIPRWEQAITAFHIIQDKSVGSNKLIDFGNKMQSEKLASVALIAYIGSTLKLDSNVEQYAIAFHSLSQWQTFIPSSIWSELVVPFHFYFWLHIIDKAGFAFRSPIILRKGIEQISLRDENATRKLMELIFDGLDIQIPVN